MSTLCAGSSPRRILAVFDEGHSYVKMEFMSLERPRAEDPYRKLPPAETFNLAFKTLARAQLIGTHQR
jgi:hypothetical protein